jgi:hypothetical protein
MYPPNRLLWRIEWDEKPAVRTVLGLVVPVDEEVVTSPPESERQSAWRRETKVRTFSSLFAWINISWINDMNCPNWASDWYTLNAPGIRFAVSRGPVPRERTAFLRLAALELSRRPNNPFWSWRRPVSPPIELISLPNRMNKSWRIWIVSGEMVLDAFFEVSYKSTYTSKDGTWSWSGGMSCWIKIWDKLLLEGISIITVRNANHQQLLWGHVYQSTKYRATLHFDLTRL